MSLSKLFKTDPKIEASGVEVQYGKQVFLVARSGGANTAYKKELTRVLKPLRRAIDTETITDEELQPKLIETFAKKAILDAWVENEDGSRSKGIDLDGSGELLAFSVESLVKIFTELPDLYRDLQQKSSNSKLFLEDLEAAAKN